MERKWMDEKSKKLIGEIITDLFPEKRRFSLFYVSFIETALFYIMKVDRIVLIPPSEAGTEFFCKVLPEIRALAGTDAEVKALVAVLLEELLKTISQPFYSEMEEKKVWMSEGPDR